MKQRVALTTAWLIGVCAVGVGGLLPDHYLQHKLGEPEPQTYPLQGVAWFLFAVTLEIAALWAIVRPASYRLSWGRALVAFVLLSTATVWFGMWLIHAPPYQGLHFLWSATVSVALLVTCCTSAVGAFRERRSGA